MPRIKKYFIIQQKPKFSFLKPALLGFGISLLICTGIDLGIQVKTRFDKTRNKLDECIVTATETEVTNL